MTGRESAQLLAIRALRALNKSSLSALQLDELPNELLHGQIIDYQRWSLILSDKNLKTLSEQNHSVPKYRLDCSSSDLIGMFKEFWFPLTTTNGIIALNITGAKAVSDYGLTLIARSSPNLLSLNITGCSKITDVALREVGLHCIGLQELIVSSCHEIIGTGLVAIAESCRNLRKFDASKCRGLEKWSLVKVFYECQALEEVNLSHLKDIGDEEVRVLAQNCPNLLLLDAVECPYVSDESILVLSQHCLDIDQIDVSRTQMAYRISDVSLLALGQRSKSLRILRLNGCENVSDVGLTWLSEGCLALEELMIARCTKITDAGLRSIGNACHNLLRIDISYAKVVTDVGVSSISSGCSKLKSINCHGVFLLADPRLSAPKKGAKLEAWQSLIGVAALAAHCPNLEELDLSGCFRLNIALHQYVSNFKQLKKLNLSGCNQATPESFAAVGNHCPQLTEISFSDCGKAVNDKAIQAFTNNCKDLKIIILSRCDYIKGGAIKGISTCNKLEKLDLSSCKNLTDSMLLHLCEVGKIPLLKTLNLIDIPLITDSILAWISIKEQRILLLAMKGTNITKKALSSVRDRFPNSDLLINNNFYGFWPKFRVDDRILLNNYYKMIDGLIRIQARHRGYKGRVRVKNIHIERKIVRSRLIIQSLVRIFLAKCKLYRKRSFYLQQNNSAVKITSIFRIAVAKARVIRRKSMLLEKMKHALAVKIQGRWRIVLASRILVLKLQAKQKYLRDRELAAVKIQSVIRMFLANAYIRLLKMMIKAREVHMNKYSAIIQRCYRGYVGRKTYWKSKKLADSMTAKRLHAAKVIQRKVRVNRARNSVNFAILIRRHRMNSLIKIQSVLRGALARLHVAEIITEREEQIRNKAAVRIQTCLRVRKAVKELRRKMRERMIQRAKEEVAANMINNQARIKLAHMRVAIARKEKLELIRQLAQLEINCAMQIQSMVRGYFGRKKFHAKLREKKGKWKELFDEKTKKRFFYNKLTGEVRWRIPQDLLDLIPYPVCDNCNYNYASVECGVCNELYCDACWYQVHAGGRRKDHDFRALYDYYGKRLDYGDGVFPSKWPTEVIQDEVQGWMLRVAPLRYPIRTYGSGWEQYEEDTADDNSRKPTTFYFNRNTFEAAYEEPEEVRQEKEQALRALAISGHMGGYYDSSGNWITNQF